MILNAVYTDRISLWWEPSPDEDFQYFNIYRDGNSLDYTASAEYLDENPLFGETMTYQVKSIDSHENFSSLSDSVEIILGTPGDPNLDGELNVLDIVIIIGIIFDYETSDYETWAGDLDGNGEVNVLDIVFLVDLILP